MATIYTKIKRKILQGDFQFSIHCLEELDNDFFTPEDAVAAVLNARDCDTITDDETHFRYRFSEFPKTKEQSLLSFFYLRER